MSVHIHAPRPESVEARSDGNCPARARDGRRCGGRRYVVKFFHWYGLEGTCYHCGARFGDDGYQTRGRAKVERVRREWTEALTRSPGSDS